MQLNIIKLDIKGGAYKMKEINRSELKFEARNQLRGNWGWAVGMTAIIFIIVGIASGMSSSQITFKNDALTIRYYSISLISALIGSYFTISFGITFLNLLRGKKDTFFNKTFSAFTQNRFVPELLTYLLSTLYTLLWTLLLIVPGIVKGYSYALAPYIVNDLVASGQEVHPNQVITDSRKLMVGHKWQLFVLHLSFIGWAILALFTFNIGNLWLVPYFYTTEANFYRKIVGDTYLKANK